MITLESICDTITSGQITSRIEAKTDAETISEIQAIVPKTVENGKIKHGELASIKIKKEPDTIRVTQKGDIIIKLSTPYDSALITSDDEGFMVTSFCVILRGFSQRYNPAFISAYLNTKHVRELLKASTAGATTPLLKVSELKKLDLPNISLQKQHEIHGLYANNMKKIEILQDLLNVSFEMSESIILCNLEVE